MHNLLSSATPKPVSGNVIPLLSNPGSLYNIGNSISLFGAIAVFSLIALPTAGPVTPALLQNFFGNWPALFTSFATALFWIGGMKYAEAWKHGFPPEPHANGLGHGLSTLGALMIGVALILLARTEVALALALIATILHAGGKLASWLSPDNDGYLKPMPLFSRVPYVTTLCLDLRSDMISHASLDDVFAKGVLPICLLLACLFWARADWLLLPKLK